MFLIEIFKTFTFDQKFLETLNQLKVYYTKRDILATYMRVPDMFKNSVKKFEFTTENKSENPDAIAYYSHKTKSITVLPDSFSIRPTDPYNFYFTFYHELSHAFDHFNSKYNEEYGLSPVHSNFMEKDEIYQKEELGLNEPIYVSDHAKKEGSTEDFAESLAMVAIANHVGLKHAKIVLSNGDIVSFKEWLNLFPNRYEYCKNLLDFY